MWARFFLAIIVCTLLAATMGCGKSADSNTPRRYGYPRIARTDSVRMALQAGPHATISLSATAETDTSREGWITALYAPLGATLYLSASGPMDKESLARAIANRRQRISLNLGGATARTDTYTTDRGFVCETVTSYDGCATPVQFIATDSAMMVSGAFLLKGRTEPADSLRPIVDELAEEAFEICSSVARR